jgi:hypothetical protein
VIKNQFVDLVSIQTTPKSGDSFGQLSGGELVLKGKLFHLPSFKLLAGQKQKNLSFFSFSLDDCGNYFHGADTFFIPLVESSGLSTHEGDMICGLLLQAEGGMGRQGTFQRVGFAVVSHVDGDVAD